MALYCTTPSAVMGDVIPHISRSTQEDGGLTCRINTSIERKDASRFLKVENTTMGRSGRQRIDPRASSRRPLATSRMCNGAFDLQDEEDCEQIPSISGRNMSVLEESARRGEYRMPYSNKIDLTEYIPTPDPLLMPDVVLPAADISLASLAFGIQLPNIGAAAHKSNVPPLFVPAGSAQTQGLTFAPSLGDESIQDVAASVVRSAAAASSCDLSVFRLSAFICEIVSYFFGWILWLVGSNSDNSRLNGFFSFIKNFYIAAMLEIFEISPGRFEAEMKGPASLILCTVVQRAYNTVAHVLQKGFLLFTSTLFRGKLDFLSGLPSRKPCNPRCMSTYLVSGSGVGMPWYNFGVNNQFGGSMNFYTGNNNDNKVLLILTSCCSDRSAALDENGCIMLQAVRGLVGNLRYEIYGNSIGGKNNISVQQQILGCIDEQELKKSCGGAESLAHVFGYDSSNCRKGIYNFNEFENEHGCHTSSNNVCTTNRGTLSSGYMSAKTDSSLTAVKVLSRRVVCAEFLPLIGGEGVALIIGYSNGVLQALVWQSSTYTSQFSGQENICLRFGMDLNDAAAATDAAFAYEQRSFLNKGKGKNGMWVRAWQITLDSAPIQICKSIEGDVMFVLTQRSVWGIDCTYSSCWSAYEQYIQPRVSKASGWITVGGGFLFGDYPEAITAVPNCRCAVLSDRGNVTLLQYIQSNEYKAACWDVLGRAQLPTDLSIVHKSNAKSRIKNAEINQDLFTSMQQNWVSIHYSKVWDCLYVLREPNSSILIISCAGLHRINTNDGNIQYNNPSHGLFGTITNAIKLFCGIDNYDCIIRAFIARVPPRTPPRSLLPYEKKTVNKIIDEDFDEKSNSAENEDIYYNNWRTYNSEIFKRRKNYWQKEILLDQIRPLIGSIRWVEMYEEQYCGCVYLAFICSGTNDVIILNDFMGKSQKETQQHFINIQHRIAPPFPYMEACAVHFSSVKYQSARCTDYKSGVGICGPNYILCALPILTVSWGQRFPPLLDIFGKFELVPILTCTYTLPHTKGNTAQSSIHMHEHITDIHHMAGGSTSPRRRIWDENYNFGNNFNDLPASRNIHNLINTTIQERDLPLTLSALEHTGTNPYEEFFSSTDNIFRKNNDNQQNNKKDVICSQMEIIKKQQEEIDNMRFGRNIYTPGIKRGGNVCDNYNLNRNINQSMYTSSSSHQHNLHKKMHNIVHSHASPLTRYRQGRRQLQQSVAASTALLNEVSSMGLSEYVPRDTYNIKKYIHHDYMYKDKDSGMLTYMDIDELPSRYNYGKWPSYNKNNLINARNKPYIIPNNNINIYGQGNCAAQYPQMYTPLSSAYNP